MQTLLLGISHLAGCSSPSLGQKASALVSPASADVHTRQCRSLHPAAGIAGFQCLFICTPLHRTGQLNLTHNAGCFWPPTCPSNRQGLDLYAWKPEASYCNPAGLVSVLITDFPLGNN